MSSGTPVPDLTLSTSAPTAGVNYFCNVQLLYVLSPVVGGSHDGVAAGDPVGDDVGGVVERVGPMVSPVVEAALVLVGAEETVGLGCTVGTGVSDDSVIEGDSVAKYAALKVGDTIVGNGVGTGIGIGGMRRQGSVIRTITFIERFRPHGIDNNYTIHHLFIFKRHHT